MTTADVGRLLTPTTGRTVATTYLARGWPDAEQVRLIDSIREHGILEPLEVAGVWLKSGHHRYWAAVWLHLATMPVTFSGGETPVQLVTPERTSRAQ